MQVIGVFNPGVACHNDETVFLVRVAERPICKEGECLVPVFDAVSREIRIRRFLLADSKIDVSDARVVKTPEGNYLTSISHLRVARLQPDGSFRVDQQPALMPQTEYEAYGIEDPRITLIGDVYYVTYSAISDRGIVAALATTRDFREFERAGIIFHPDNKDVALFPSLSGGKYYALHRPSSSLYGRPEIWIAESEDLLCWGNHKHVMGVRPGSWDSGRIGASAVPFLTDYGWLEIYHGADEHNRYCLGAVLLDTEEPWKVLARSPSPILTPEMPYETDGFFGKVVFSCGALVIGTDVQIFYGASDTSIASVEIPLSGILEQLGVTIREVV